MLGEKTRNRAVAELSGSHGDIHGLHRFSPFCAHGIMTPQHMPNGSHQSKQAPRLLQGFDNITGENSSFHSGKLGSRHRKPDMPQKQQSNSFLNQGSLCKMSSRFLHITDCFGELVLVCLRNLEKTSSK